eukprot:11318959-Alexandrium_andersonii.AAC.1
MVHVRSGCFSRVPPPGTAAPPAQPATDRRESQSGAATGAPPPPPPPSPPGAFARGLLSRPRGALCDNKPRAIPNAEEQGEVGFGEGIVC